MKLSKEDRDRFAEYLENDADELDKVIAKLGAIPAGGILAQKLRADVAAARTIAHKLRQADESPIERTTP